VNHSIDRPLHSDSVSGAIESNSGKLFSCDKFDALALEAATHEMSFMLSNYVACKYVNRTLVAGPFVDNLSALF
jgi:hypothetical protein